MAIDPQLVLNCGFLSLISRQKPKEQPMPTNTEVITALYAAFGTGDIPTVLGTLTEDVSWTEAEGFPYGGTYIGRDAVLENVFMKLGTEWDGFSAVAEELVAQGDTVVAIGEYSGAYLATGKSFAAPFVHIWRMRDGQAHTFRQITDTVLVHAAMK
jgi:ketosteroid isomerase-like protein